MVIVAKRTSTTHNSDYSDPCYHHDHRMILLYKELVSACVSNEAEFHQYILPIPVDGLSKRSNQPASIKKVDLYLVILCVPPKVAPIVVLLFGAVHEAQTGHMSTIAPNHSLSDVSIVGDIQGCTVPV